MATKPFWDIEEDKGYLLQSYNNKNYKILENNTKVTPLKRLKLLDFFNSTTLALQAFLRHHGSHLIDLSFSDRIWYPGIRIFCATPHQFQEINGNAFYGLNKPKEVHDLGTSTLPFGKDGTLRAKWRNVMINLTEYRYGQPLSDLYVHEIAHTFCNHVTYRENDHNEDFEFYETFIHRILDKYFDFTLKFNEAMT
jgi:hypothetical protein